MKLRSPAGLTVIGIGATLVITAAVVAVLFLFGGGAKAVSDNAALIGALVALGGVFTTQLVNSALEAQRAEQARKTQQTQRERDREIEQTQRERELEVGSQRAQDDAAQAYLDQMSNLLLDKDNPLRQSKEGDEVRTLARARTLTVLARLDGSRKWSVLMFLQEAGLISIKDGPVVSLKWANLQDAELGEVVLEDADLSGTKLQRARLHAANLRRARLINANLSGADLSSAGLREADLRVASLTEADLRGALLIGAHLLGADLRGADLSSADLRGADLSGAHLTEADLRSARLDGADLSGTRGWTEDQLSAAKLSATKYFEGATMPNGQKYEDWLKDKEGRKEEAGNE